jgi:membrane associated rhomboid family serine protease
MILAIVAEIMTARIPVSSRRQAMDWSLVLASQGIETAIESSPETGWGLVVPEQEHERAVRVLNQYQAENRDWPWRQRVSERGVLFDWGSVGWALLVGLFFWIQTHSTPAFRDAGLMDAAAVSRGEWWRLFTAIFLHADLGHFAMNASLGIALLGFTMGAFGTGLGLLAAYLAGAGGNIATWLILSGNHRSLGASGMVMGCVGLLAAQSLLPGRNAGPNHWKYVFGGVICGAMLFMLLGLDPQSDVLAHLGGFVGGLALGCWLRTAPRLAQNTLANILAGLAFCFLVILPWWLALAKSAG